MRWCDFEWSGLQMDPHHCPGIDPPPTVSTNLSFFLVPSICPFTFELPTLNNLGKDDMSDLAMAYGSTVAEWAHVMLLAHNQGESSIVPLPRPLHAPCCTIAS